MRLSEAIRLGSLAIQNPKSHDTRFCAIGMGLESIGQRSMGRDGSDYDAANYCSLKNHWPWTELRETDDHTAYYMRIAWMFDDHVCPSYKRKSTMTLEALCDLIASWENELESKGINVEQVTMIAIPETTCEPAAEHTKELAVNSASR